ncbi:hypothetical protein [Tsukamurella tyrosinosolvens]|uniref:hypothetical protein n=1 Tax=Tsukamurella tyrosinosolvens TaxID=57704 RepID=UPI003F4A6ED4
MSVPWPITAVESRGGTVVRIRHADGTTADHDFEYLLGGAGVFAHLTEEMTPTAAICNGGTVGWETEAGVVDLAPDVLWEHAVMGLCPRGVCRGWTPERTVLVHRGGR